MFEFTIIHRPIAQFTGLGFCIAVRGGHWFAGAPDFANGHGTPLLRPVLRVNLEVRALADEGIAWERAIHLLPTLPALLARC